MKKIYAVILMLFTSASVFSQYIKSVNSYFIPSSGSVTVTIAGHNTFFTTHPVNYVSLTQPHNSDGSSFTSVSETVVSDDTITATFNISNPNHGGYYDVTVVAAGITINTKKDGVYMTGKDPRRVNSMTPNFGLASSTITAQLTGAQMHFMTSTGYPQIGSVRLTSEIDNSFINNSTINYIDSNNVNVDFNIPYNATNGKYKLNVDLQNLNQTNRPYFFTVAGGIPKRIVSVTPHECQLGSNMQVMVTVFGRNLITQPVTWAYLNSELTTYSNYISGGNMNTIDSNHISLSFTIPTSAPDGDYYITLGGNPSLTKHYAFRVLPPDLRGVIYLDADSNGVQNGAEHGLGNRKVLLLPDSIYAYTDYQGKFFYYADPGNYTLQYCSDTVYTLTSTPSVYNFTVTNTPQSGFNFGLYKMPSYQHTFYGSWQHMRCNQNTYTYWSIYNPEDVVHNGVVTLIHSPNLIVTSTSIPPTSVNGDTMVWNYSANPLQTLNCGVTFMCPSAGQSVWYNYTDQIANHTYHYTFSGVVACSWDPNDKSVYPAETPSAPATLNTETLEYNINFQNTGNDTAFQVVIDDTLSAFLDLESFEIIASSHAMTANLDYPNRIVSFRFENILLPDSNVDEPGSHGFVRYRIKALQGIPDSSEVTNTGYIYFDFNPAVITNTVTSHLVYFLLPQASFTTASQSICQLDCINFASTSAYATSWQWSFPGGIPSTSTDENPQGICFLNTGTYDVTLIATNGFSSDTLVMPGYLAVNQLPSPPVIFESNDTLYCMPDQFYTAYQWYDTTGLISGATNNYYVPPVSGLYGISVYNAQGCEAASAYPIILKISDPVLHDAGTYPNPAHEKLYVRNRFSSGEATVTITTIKGEKVITAIVHSSMTSDSEIDIRNLSPGMYFVRFQNQEQSFVKRFIKN